MRSLARGHAWRDLARVGAHTALLLGAALAPMGCAPRAASSHGPATGDGADEQVVPLAAVADTLPAVRPGLTNIGFAPLDDSLRARAVLGADWQQPEVADVVGGRGIHPIFVARFREAGSDSLRYVLDTAGTLDFVNGRTLAFRRAGRLRVAQEVLAVRSLAGATAKRPYQVLLADDGYSYAWIAEYHAGEIRVGGRSFAVRVRSRSRAHPFPTLDPGTVVLADLDGDGTIAEVPSVSAGGRMASAEELVPSAPFLLGGELLELTGIDSAGSALRLRRSRRQVAAVPGLRAPELQATPLDGARYRLSSDAGRVRLVEFWATDCAFSERVRDRVNTLATEMDARPFTWLAIARGQHPDTVRRHLATHPMGGLVAMADSATWAEYNPNGITPLFLVIDAKGVVRHRAAGASAVAGVIDTVRALVGGPAGR